MSGVPRRPWKVFASGETIAIKDANGREIINWMGFDASDVRGSWNRRVMAHHIVDCVNEAERAKRRAARTQEESESHG